MVTIQSADLATGQGPKYQRLAEAIRVGVETGDLATGEKLPPVRELAWELDITPGTVARAYALLQSQGIVEAGVGRGTFVAEQKPLVQEDETFPDAGVDWPADWSADAASAMAPLRLLSPRLPDVGQVDTLRQAMVRASRMPAELLLNYPNRVTQRGLQKAAFNLLPKEALGRLNPEDLVLTHGGQNAITIIFQSILRGPDPVVLVEELSYSGFRRAADAMRARVIPVPMDEKGVIPAALDEIATREKNVQIFCTTAEVQNPTCMTTPLERRKEIGAVARKHGFAVVQDDCYRLSAATAPAYRRIVPELGWHIDSLSKVYSAALRIGFAIAPPAHATELRRRAEQGYFGLSTPLVETARFFLEDPRTPEFADAIRARVAEYVRAAVNALGRFEIRWNEDVPFIWLRLPQGWRSSGFCQEAEARGIRVRSADEFVGRDQRAPHAVRVSVNAQVPLDQYVAACRELAQLLDNPPEQNSV